MKLPPSNYGDEALPDGIDGRAIPYDPAGDMAAYDALPPGMRSLVARAPFPVAMVSVRDVLRRHGEAAATQLLRQFLDEAWAKLRVEEPRP